MDYFTFNLGFSKDEFWFYFLTSGVVIITGFFLIPLLILVYVQVGNFCAGKTMLERYSRSGQGSDNITQRLLNSGIRHDALILAQVRRLQEKSSYNDSIMLTKQLTERLTEGSGGKGSSVPRRSNFCNMVCQRTMRP